MKLQGRVVNIAELLPQEKQRMFEILAAYFENVSAENFSRDMEEKDWVILLRDKDTQCIRGFSTLRLMQEEVLGQNVWAVFSGDTIIEREFWGDSELARVWLEFMLSLRRKYSFPKFYWFLISMGYKTYRFLPVYFKRFYPCHGQVIPGFEKQVMDTLAYARFGSQYNAETGVIHFEQSRERLKEGVADIDDRRRRNPHVRYFLNQNPHYGLGDELVCLAEISEDNLKRAAYKVMGESVV